MNEAEPCFPTIHIKADSIPLAWYRALKAVWENGVEIRTEYDRKNAIGEFIDPPSRDAKVLIEVTNPFNQPRYSPLSFCEIGAYIAEICGVKDNLVMPMSELVVARDGKSLPATLWPYSYHQRLTAHPEAAQAIIEQIELRLAEIEGKYQIENKRSRVHNRKPAVSDNAMFWITYLAQALSKLQSAYGEPIDQIEKAVETLAKVPYSRRAVCTTAVPNLDPFMTEDIPCLRELALRLIDDGQGGYLLNATTLWRSRDLYKAWSDNVIAITFFLQLVAQRIEAKMAELGQTKKVRVGSYADFSASLHIYGQDFSAVGGDAAKSMASIFEAFPDEATFISRCYDSETANYMFVTPQLETLLSDQNIVQWKFGETQIAQINQLLENLKNGQLTA